jgi:predicted phage terminase large subunit-like protein
MSDRPAVLLNADKAAAELCKRKLSFFVREFWDIIIEEDLEWAPHMDVLCDEIQAVYERVIARQPKLYDLIINIPPGTSKSTIVTIMAPIWSWTRDASLRHITASYSETLSTEHAVKSRDIVRCARFKRYFPHVVIKPDEDNKTNYKTVKNGQRFVTSVTGTVTGVHAHIITVDDPLNPKQAASEAELAEANRFFDQTITTRKVDKRVTPLILIMQRLAQNDPSGHLLEKKKVGIRHICLPATLAPNVKPVEYRDIYEDDHLDINRLGPEVLAEMKVDLGSYGYAGQFDQSPVPAGGLIWKKWFIEIPDHDWPDKKYGTDHGTDWDLAYTKDDDNAASAYVDSFRFNNRIFIEDYDWAWLEFPDLIKWMKTKQAPYYIEAKASGKSSKQTLSKQGIVAIEIPVKGGSDKLARARMATPIAESGIVCIRKSMADRIYNDSRQGILHFPKGQFKDLADALAQCLQRHSTVGFKYHSDSDSEDWKEEQDLLGQLGW